jgi:hypothetical protein
MRRCIRQNIGRHDEPFTISKFKFVTLYRSIIAMLSHRSRANNISPRLGPSGPHPSGPAGPCTVPNGRRPAAGRRRLVSVTVAWRPPGPGPPPAAGRRRVTDGSAPLLSTCSVQCLQRRPARVCRPAAPAVPAGGAYSAGRRRVHAYNNSVRYELQPTRWPDECGHLRASKTIV